MAGKAILPSNEKTQLPASRAQQIQLAGSAVGIGSLVIALLLGLRYDDGMSRFFHSYLLGFAFWLSLACGALWFVLLHHVVKAHWSTTLRRTAEILTAPLGVLTVLSLVIVLPLWLGNHSLYIWSDPEIAHSDHLIHAKAAWLNVGFFGIRVLAYMAILTGIAWWFRKKSVEQDSSGDAKLSGTMRKVSAPMMILFAFVIEFIGFDLLMALEPRWFSTMWGVYYFAGAGIAMVAMLALVPMLWQRLGLVRRSITVEHYHDVGKWLFAFVFFWGYIAFSQFMLIWYGNLPEETAYFTFRIFGDWQKVAIAILVFHLSLPFIFLLSRHTKRRLAVLAGFSAWMFVMHWVDLYWIVMPTYSPHEMALGLIDILATLGIGGLYIAAAAHTAARVHLVPIKDPRLGKCLRFENM